MNDELMSRLKGILAVKFGIIDSLAGKMPRVEAYERWIKLYNEVFQQEPAIKDESDFNEIAVMNRIYASLYANMMLIDEIYGGKNE